MKNIFKSITITIIIFILIGCNEDGSSGKYREYRLLSGLIKISLTKQNEPPIFTSPNSVSVNENQTSALTLTATDVDSPILIFIIKGTDASSFNLNNATLTFKIAPNYETKKIYKLTAIVSDENNSVEQNITISILNIPDVLPILGGDLNLTIYENTKIGVNIGTISINTIGDSAISNMEVNGTNSNTFAISTTNGAITLKSLLDYNTKSLYEFNVTAINNAGRSNTIKLTINILKYTKLAIRLAVYDNNSTSVSTDDRLRIYFTKDIDSVTRSTNSISNYLVSGIGDISNAIGSYTSTFKEDKLKTINIALIPYETNISIKSNSIQDTNSTFANTNPHSIISAYNIKKTGQTISKVTNDDGTYQKGITPIYNRDNINNIVLDNITGLMWQDNIEANTTQKQLITTANYTAGNYLDTSGDTASTYCSSLTLGGYTDWRIPLALELLKIIDYTKSSPSMDTSYFKYTASNRYWSSTPYNGTTRASFYLDISDGGLSVYNKKTAYNIRCVRRNKLAKHKIIRDNTKNVVIDNNTKLMWQDDGAVSFITLPSMISAINACESLNLGGYFDWRLANVNELNSIVDRNLSPSIISGFLRVSSNYYWSSTDYIDNPNTFWTVSFFKGRVSFSSDGTSNYVRCVRDL